MRQVYRLAYPEGESQEVGCESKDGEGGGVEDCPVRRQAEGDIAELDDLIDGEGQCEKGRPDECKSEAEGGHGKEKDISKDDEDVVKWNDAFPSEAGEESDAPEFLVLCKGLKIHHEEVGEGEESERDGNGEEAVRAARLEDERNGGKYVGKVYGEEQFAETTVDQSKWRNGVDEDDREGKAKKEERSRGKLFGRK